MTVCGNSLSGICGACEHLNACRNSELDKVPMTNEEWFCGLSTAEKAKVLGRVSFCDFCPHQLGEHCAWTTGYGEDCVYGNKESEELWVDWLKQPHSKGKEKHE